MEVEVPEAVHVRDLEGARFARRKIVGVVTRSSFFSCAKETLLPHVAAHRGVRGHHAETWVLAGERFEIVVVELKGPARMLAVEALERIAERRRNTRVGAGVLRNFAREDGDRIGGTACGVEPSLDGLEGEANAIAGGGMRPGLGRELGEADAKLAVVGRSGEQRTDDLKAQTCPSHARRRVVARCHVSPCGREGGVAASAKTLR